MTDSARTALIDQRVRDLGPDLLFAYGCWLIGAPFSAHRFYLRRPFSGALQILSYLFLIGVVWWLIDGIRLPRMIEQRRAKMRAAMLASPEIVAKPGAIEAIGFTGRITLDDGNVIISREPSSIWAGLLTFLTLGVQGPKTIPVRNITAVQMKDAGYLLNGYLRLSINGRDPIGGITTAVRDENAIMFTLQNMVSFRIMRDALQAQMDVIRTQPPPSVPTPLASQADELEKMANLHDRGVLTDAEFAAKKQQILGL